MRETQVQSLGQEDPLEKEMATHFSTLAWKIHGWRSLVGYSPWGCKESDTTERLHFHFFTQSQNGVWFSPLILKEGFLSLFFFFFNDISSYLLISAWNWRNCFGLECSIRMLVRALLSFNLTRFRKLFVSLIPHVIVYLFESSCLYLDIHKEFLLILSCFFKVSEFDSNGGGWGYNLVHLSLDIYFQLGFLTLTGSL